jgi:MoaA/NifB/PqqE/SkfB family radical SAM enzyme
LNTLRLNRIPGQLVIQFTDHCNGKCPQCGMRSTEIFDRSILPLDDVRRILDRAAQQGVKIVSFTGGEPLLHLKDLQIMIKYAGSAGIEFIRTGTNGFIFRDPERAHFMYRIKKVAESLAKTPLRNFWISIDSAVPAIHEAMRGFPGVVKGIEKALPVFHECGIFPSANLGINRNVGGVATGSLLRAEQARMEDHWRGFYLAYRTAFREFYRLVIDLGFTMVNTCYPMSIHEDGERTSLKPVYAATSEESIVSFTPMEKGLLFKALLETLPEFKGRTRVFSPRSALYALYRASRGLPDASYPCRGGKDFFFIDAKDGNVYPCGYRGHENMGKYWELEIHDRSGPGDCYRCEWECFRDPSELFGPLLQVLSNPLQLLNRWRQDPHFFHLWIDDLRYYRACGFFNGREPADFERLRLFRN